MQHKMNPNDNTMTVTIAGISVKLSASTIRFLMRTGLPRFLIAKRNNIAGRKVYRSNLRLYNTLNKDDSFAYQAGYRYPCLQDRYKSAGSLHSYFWQDLWAAKLIHDKNPGSHYDIGSRVDGFIAHLASFRERIYMVDIRPMENVIPGVEFVQADATNLENFADGSIESISALCSLEHFGLGRYGDDIDPDGFIKVSKAIARVLSDGGDAYIAVPIGWQHLEFDAHRIFYAQTVIDAFAPLKCVELSCTHDGIIEYNIPVHKYDDYKLGGSLFGLFHFVK